MGLSIGEHITASYHWVACLRSLLCTLMKGLFYARDVLIRHIITNGSILEDAAKVCIWVVDIFVYWLNVAYNFRILTSTTTLLLVQVVELCFSTDSLSVVHSWVAHD